ncbi:twin-arginine translocase TatA/TatE family subunit [Geodermatophilus sp. URMC 64]
MAGLGAPEIGLILLAVFLLVGYKKLPDATRALGRSLRILRGELRAPVDAGTRDAA